MSNKKTKPLVFRATEKERQLLDELVANYNANVENSKRINKNQLMQAMVRNLIGLGPEFLKPELHALKETNRCLLGIGRNVNQIVKKIHQGELPADTLSEKYLKTIAAYVTESRDNIEQIVQRNQRRAQLPLIRGEG